MKTFFATTAAMLLFFGILPEPAAAVDIKPQVISGSATMTGQKPRDLKITASVEFGNPGYKDLRIVTNQIGGDTLEMNVVATAKSGVFPQVITKDTAVRTLIDFRLKHPGITKVKLIGANGQSVTVNIAR